MSRRRGQNPSVRIGKRADGKKYFYFQCRVDVAGQEKRQRQTEVLGIVGQMTASEANRRKIDFLQKLELNSSDYRIPSSKRFADAVKYYQEVFAPRMLRASTFDVAKTHISVHLEPYWADVPVEHIAIDAVNKWAWTKRPELSWVTIKNILRTMQRVLSCYLRKPSFSLRDLEIPAKDKLQMQMDSRDAVSFSWGDAKRIVSAVGELPDLDAGRKRQYATAFILAAATGLRSCELFALRMDDIDFAARTIRVDESTQRADGIGQCKNRMAYRDVFLGDPEGTEALRMLKAFVGDRIQNPRELVFHSRRGAPLSGTNVLHDGLHPALKAVWLPRAGLHAFRRGCNRRWELAGVNAAVLRQLMGHSSSAMTARYTGVVPIAQVQAAFSNNGAKPSVSESVENAVAV